jgi:hypothetical protein
MAAFTLSRDTGVGMTRLGLTRKQYYSRMNQLINAGLVMRKSGKYFLTSFGKVVYEFHKLIGQAVESYWKLRAIDSVVMPFPENEFSVEDRKKMIDSLIENNNIKNILFNYNVPSNQRDKISTPTIPQMTNKQLQSVF